MATVEEALLTYLRAHTPLTAKVGSKIFFLEATQDTAPDYVVFFKIAGSRLHDIPFASPLLQVSYFSENEWDAVTGAEIIVSAIKGFSGYMGSLFIAQGIYVSDRVLKQGDIYHAPVDIRLSLMEE